MKPVLTINSKGTKAWRINGIYHREGGPAVINSNGTKRWYLNGECHRIDGPAIIDSDGYKYWYINSNYCTQKIWFNILIKEYLK